MKTPRSTHDILPLRWALISVALLIAISIARPARAQEIIWYNSLPSQVLPGVTNRLNVGFRLEHGFDISNAALAVTFPSSAQLVGAHPTNHTVVYTYPLFHVYSAAQLYIDVVASTTGVFQVGLNLTGTGPTGQVVDVSTSFPLRVTQSLLSVYPAMGPDRDYAYFSVRNDGVGPADNVHVFANIEHLGYDRTGLELMSTYISSGQVVNTNFFATPATPGLANRLTVEAVIPSLAPGAQVEGGLALRLNVQADTVADFIVELTADEAGVPLYDRPRMAGISGTRLLSWSTYGQPTDYNRDGWPDLATIIKDEQDLGAYLLAGGSLTSSTPVGTVIDPIAVPGDYTGDTLVDPAIYDAADTGWLIPPGPGEPAAKKKWGPKRALPVPADYNGDRRMDRAVFVPSTGRWIVEVNGQTVNLNWGSINAVPVPGDFDRDGRADVTVYFPTTGEWYTKFASGARSRISFGGPGMAPFTGDFDGNGTLDRAVFQRSAGTWFVRLSDGHIFTKQWGYAEGWPMVADVNADGFADLCVCDPPTGRWFILTGRSEQFLQRASRPGSVPANLQFQINRRLRLLP